MNQTEKKQEKKSKMQLKQEKILNEEMVQTSKKTRKHTGICAVHPDRSIFQTEKGRFIKIYSIKGLDNSALRKELLVRSLCNCADQRIRISAFLHKGNSMPIFFLSVFFQGKNYADIYNDVKNFDLLLEGILKENIRISIKPCCLNDIFMFIYMNCNAQIKKISQKQILRKMADWKQEYFADIIPEDFGYEIPKVKKYGCSYMALQYPDHSERIFDLIRQQTGCSILSSVDIQKIPEKYFQAYKTYIQELYNDMTETELEKLINVTFIFTITVDSKKELETVDRLIQKQFYNAGFVISKCNDIEKDIFNSIALLGLYDFHCMRNVKETEIASLII